MSEENEKGFVIKDKRTLNETGEAKADESGEKAPKKEAPKRPVQDQMPLPEVNFPSLIFSLSSTALFHLGELPDPQTNEKKKDLSLAKHTIDTIAMLKEKTAGKPEQRRRKIHCKRSHGPSAQVCEGKEIKI
jgi:hypothetical protein